MFWDLSVAMEGSIASIADKYLSDNQAGNDK